MTVPELFDVLIVGSGPAGLSVATGVVRQLYKVVIFGDGVYRNSRSAGMHNFVGWDGQDPAAFLSKARADLERYETVRFEDTTIQKVRKTDAGHFEAQDDQGRVWTGRKLVIATGAEEVFPDIAGYGDCWGYGIIASVCCVGTDYLGGPDPSLGIICEHSAAKLQTALNLSYVCRRYTDKVTLYTNGNDDLAEGLKAELAKEKGGRNSLVTVNNQLISRLARGPESRASMIVTLADGTEVHEAFLMGQPFSKTRGTLAQQLSLKMTPTGHVDTSLGHETSVQGAWAVGDCATPLNALTRAIAQGSLAAGGLLYQLGADYAKIG